MRPRADRTPVEAVRTVRGAGLPGRWCADGRRSVVGGLVLQPSGMHVLYASAREPHGNQPLRSAGDDDAAAALGTRCHRGPTASRVTT
jgi:hypothetical protein